MQITLTRTLLKTFSGEMLGANLEVELTQAASLGVDYPRL